MQQLRGGFWMLYWQVREKEGLSNASNSFQEGSEVERNSHFSKLPVNKLSPSGIYEELTFNCKGRFYFHMLWNVNTDNILVLFESTFRVSKQEWFICTKFSDTFLHRQLLWSQSSHSLRELLVGIVWHPFWGEEISLNTGGLFEVLKIKTSRKN